MATSEQVLAPGSEISKQFPVIVGVPNFVNNKLGERLCAFEDLQSYRAASGDGSLQGLANDIYCSVVYISQEFGLGEHLQETGIANLTTEVVQTPQSISDRLRMLYVGQQETMRILEITELKWRGARKIKPRQQLRKEANVFHDSIEQCSKAIVALQGEWMIG